LTEFNAQVNELFITVTIIFKKKNTSKELVQQQTSYIKAVEAHLHVANRHDLRKKPMSMIKIGLLQLEKSCCQICLFEDMLDSYCAMVRCLFPLAIHALTDIFQNNLSAESVKRRDDNKLTSL